MDFIYLRFADPLLKTILKVHNFYPGWWFQALWKIVSWDDSSQYGKLKKKFRTTNQITFINCFANLSALVKQLPKRVAARPPGYTHRSLWVDWLVVDSRWRKAVAYDHWSTWSIFDSPPKLSLLLVIVIFHLQYSIQNYIIELSIQG